jgi:hypothetical protein
VTPQEAIDRNSIPVNPKVRWDLPQKAVAAKEKLTVSTSTYAYIGLFIHDDGRIHLYREGKMVTAVKAIEIDGGAVKVTDEDGAVQTFGPKAAPKSTDAPLPPRSFPNVHQAIADYFDCREGSIEDQVASIFNR